MLQIGDIVGVSSDIVGVSINTQVLGTNQNINSNVTTNTTVMQCIHYFKIGDVSC